MTPLLNLSELYVYSQEVTSHVATEIYTWETEGLKMNGFKRTHSTNAQITHARTSCLLAVWLMWQQPWEVRLVYAGSKTRSLLLTIKKSPAISLMTLKNTLK